MTYPPLHYFLMSIIQMNDELDEATEHEDMLAALTVIPDNAATHAEKKRVHWKKDEIAAEVRWASVGGRTWLCGKETCRWNTGPKPNCLDIPKRQSSADYLLACPGR